MEESADLTSAYPGGIPNRIEVKTTNGKTLVREDKYPPGHVKNPISDEVLQEKYLPLIGLVLGKDRAGLLSKRIWKLETIANIQELCDLLVV